MNAKTSQTDPTDWKSDFFGALNQMPAEPVVAIGQGLEAMSTFPAFQCARQWLLQNLGLSRGSSLIEAGCGTGTALPDILSIVGADGHITGIDPTKHFVETACSRAKKLGASNARYEIGDIRSMLVKDGAFDAVFCDKVLIHAGPARAALSEMMRVVRNGGRVGAVEWLPLFAISSRQFKALEAFNQIFKTAVYDYYISVNLARHFHAVGLQNIHCRAFLAHTDNLDSHPFWRGFMFDQLPMFIQAGLIDDSTARIFQDDLEDLNIKGECSASFIVQAAVGTK